MPEENLSFEDVRHDAGPKAGMEEQGEKDTAEAYCFRCKSKKPVTAATETRMKNGRMALSGSCITCGAKVFKILAGERRQTQHL
jgi:DNA-directed RNA polymerase subunit M/transcription elongation factor TFIIS